MRRALVLILLVAGCGGTEGGRDPDAGPGDASVDPGQDASVDAGDPWADRVVAFSPGPGAGFGQDRFPGIVLGPPRGAGASMGSLDGLSLGLEGSITLELVDVEAIDGPGVDLLVFENPFLGFVETGVVEVSEDGVQWREFPCAALVDGGTAGCAGVTPVSANPEAGISGTDPGVSGGDGFDLAEVGLTRAHFVRIRDSGKNRFYGAPSGGFDLDAVAVVNGARR